LLAEISRVTTARDTRRAFEELLASSQAWLIEKAAENLSNAKFEPFSSEAIENLLFEFKVINLLIIKIRY